MGKDQNVLIFGRDASNGTVRPISVSDGGVVVSISDVPPAAPLVGQKAIAVTGTAIQLHASTATLPGAMVMVRADSDNTDPIVVGGSGVENTVDGSGNGTILQPGDAMPFFVSSVNALYINGTADDVASFSAG